VSARRWIALLGTALSLAGPARAEMYRWVDASGVVHVTENLLEVPPDQRPRADQEALELERRPARWGRVDAPPAAPAARRSRPAARSTGAVHRIAIAPAGHEIRLDAELNSAVSVPFVADTGASINTIPRWAVERLGLDVPRDAPVIGMVGVSGQPMRVPLVQLESVQVGGAVVHDLEMAVVDTLETGLLGMPFFNHFKVQIDPTQGVMTLEEIPPGVIEGVYGGYDEAMWRKKYAQIRREQARIDALIERVPSSYTSIIEKLEDERAYWDDQLDQLEERAQRAGVPHAWRD
jgi:hypothetical protein